MNQKGIVLAVALGLSLFAKAGERIQLSRQTIDTSQSALQIQTTRENNVEWIVQFKQAPTEGLKNELRKHGLEIFSYLPQDAFIVRATSQQLDGLQNKSFIQAIVEFKPEYKLARSLQPVSVFDADLYEGLIVKLYKASELVTFKNYLQSLQVQVLEAQGDSLSLRASRSMRMLIAQRAEVEHIQNWVQMIPMHFQVSPQDTGAAPMAGDYKDLSGYESGAKIMNFETAWSQGYTGRGQVAAMADTGLDTGNMGSIASDFNGAILSGYFFGLFSKSWEDPMGHGTHVAGSIMGRGTASGGALKGGAYEAQFVAESIWSPMLNNLSIPNKLSDLFEKAYKDGARVHSNSWGSARSFGEYDSFSNQVDTWAFNNPEMLILFAAGNSGVDKNRDGRIDGNSIGSPGTSKNILTVGASENFLSQGGIQVPIGKLKSSPENWPVAPITESTVSDNPNGMAMFSSRGPTVDGRLKPEIVAPGTNILSTRSHVQGAEVLWGAYNEHYVYSGGTSMSTPLTAGAATVLRQILVESLKIESPTAALVKAAMLHTAVDMFPGQYGENGVARGQEFATRRPNNDEGFGRVDVSNFLKLGQAFTKLVDEKVGVATGEEKSFTMTSSGGKLLVNLVYTDAPASANAAKALVNDLDLKITLPNGQVVSPQDRVNNQELVELAQVPAGTVMITVRGQSVPQGKSGRLPYAVIATIQ